VKTLTAFIKAIEIWVPSKDQMRLEFCNGHYGELKTFQEASVTKTFDFNQGLPGKAWAAGHPIVLNEFEDSYFERTEAARIVGIGAGIAMPVFSGDFLKAIIVFLCSDDEDSLGAIEIWHCDTASEHDLSLMDGHFGTLEHFEFQSLHTSFRKGTGLPGLVWESGMPIVLDDLGLSHRFLRSQDAIEAGITAGLGMPLFHDKQHVYIMTFLSAQGTPISRQIEVWIPDASRKKLTFQSGFSEAEINLTEHYKDTYIKVGEDTIGRVFLTGVPSICDDLKDKSGLDISLTSLVAIPVIEDGKCKCVVAMYS